MGKIYTTYEHPKDVLAALLNWQSTSEPCAIVVVTETEGGSVRAPGALMAVSHNGSAGYISGGCIDSDVITQAREAIAIGEVKRFRYGRGSPFVDLPLPCGGAIEVLIVPEPNPEMIRKAHDKLLARQPVVLRFDELVGKTLDAAMTLGDEGGVAFRYEPKLRIRIAGRGADCLALASLCESTGIEVSLQLIDDEDVEVAQELVDADVERLSTQSQMPANRDDSWTAFALLFHDGDWEIPLLQQALSGPAFYIGAVGSKRTHSQRCERLLQAGEVAADIGRIRGPIGLVPSMRDASMLAVSAFAEIVDAFHNREPRTALLMLAAGASSRFEDGDKLLADMNGRAVLAHAAALKGASKFTGAYAVVPNAKGRRAQILSEMGWQIIENPAAEAGQSSSLNCGMRIIQNDPSIEQVIIILADMPLVPASHLKALIDAQLETSAAALMTKAGDILCPPALFQREAFQALIGLEADQGAKKVFLGMENTQTMDVDPALIIDVDRVADLQRAMELTDG